MSENEGAIERSEDKTNEIQHQNKKIKLETPLVLDKSQEEAIDKLVQNSHLAKEKEEEEQANSKNNDKNSSNENLSNGEGSLPAIRNPENKSSITSEQLLYALTSSVPAQNDKNKDKPSPNKKQSNASPPSPSTKNNGSTVQNTSSIITTLPKLPTSSSSNNNNNNKTTSASSSPTSHSLSNVKSPATTSTSTGPNTSSSSLPTSSLKTTSTTTSNLGFNSLPDISAALRRLSSTPVIEQLTGTSSSPRQEHQQRKGSDSASEILGNALAAVAARPSHLAAFTANISNLLHSTGFEDTQKKLAAAVMRKKISPAEEEKKSKLVVNNSKVWSLLEGMEEKSLGFYVYTPQFILPNLENHINGTVEIRVPARYLSYEALKVQQRALWGTDIYTDDSDVVAMMIHSGKYQPPFQEKTQVESNDPFALVIAGKTREAMEETRKRALCGKTYLNNNVDLHLDHDVKVVLRVLPKLQDYASSIRHRIKSRHWGGSHDGVSVYVDKVEKIKKGEARLKGKSSLKTNMFLHEKNRKDALGLKKKQDEPVQYVRKGRVKKSHRVMRMFQMRSEMINKNS